MEKTIKINLGGVLFQIEEEAYRILRKYLGDIDARLRNTQGGAETLEDIEARVSEIFRSRGGQAGVISKENVEEVISIIGSPETFEVGGDFRETDSSAFSQPIRKKMYRNPDDKIIGGVCSGMGAYLNIEPVWMRVLFIIFTCFFGVGFFVYVALWIALPEARTEIQKREMYGDNQGASRYGGRTPGNRPSQGTANISSGPSMSSNIGNAFNEIFRAIGNVIFVIVRIFLIICGVVFVLGGFFILVSVVMVFFFRYPDYFSTHSLGINLFYFPDFLNYIVSPAAAPWIVALSFIVIALPLVALIYWGVKMIFWFRARDGVVSLIALIIWVGSVAALSMILFNEGISYSDTARSITSDVIARPPDNLYIVSGHKISELKYDKEISIPDEDYNIYFTDDNRNLYISPSLHVHRSDDRSIKIDVIKRSAGRSRLDASGKANALIYNFKVSNDTLYLDNYFTIPSGNKWSADVVSINLYIPEGTKVHFDQGTEGILHSHYQYTDSDGNEYIEEHAESGKSAEGNHNWIMTEEGLERIQPEDKK